MLPKLSAALNQIIGPVASPSKLDEKLGDQADASRTKPFEKFDPKKHGSRHKKGSSQGSGEHSGEPSQEGAPQLRVIPGGLGPGGNNLIPRESALQGKANGSSSVSFLELL